MERIIDYSKRLLVFLLEKKSELITLFLLILFLVITLSHLTLIIMNRNLEPMWMLFGVSASLLLVFTGQKSFGAIFLLIVMGTFMADEEFLLEVTAIAKGDGLSTVRESRQFTALHSASEEVREKTLSAKLSELLQKEKDPEKIIASLETSRMEFEMAEDLPGFSFSQKEAVMILAQHDGVEESDFLRLMEEKGIKANEAIDSLEVLAAAEYLHLDSQNQKSIALTKKGKALAKKLENKLVIN
ncbi:MAG: hypothetical protein K1X66_05405 [Verrucomicrobiae bacterium]|nr:hypothetical protein [Verrucomicrobiae bacterium]